MDKIEEGKYYLLVPEEVLRESAAVMAEAGEANNTYQRMLESVQIYKEAELTPVVLYDVHTSSLICIVKELQNKLLH